MQDASRYAVGIDVGSHYVRCVVGHFDSTNGTPNIVGVSEVVNSGMRKGAIVHLNGPAKAIDDALAEAERMSGFEVNSASVNINGSHILSTVTDGMVAVGAVDHIVTKDDVLRLEEVATIGKVPANREILKVVAHSFSLDGQDNIKDPVGMTGTRLEINANVISALVPQVGALKSVLELVKVHPNSMTPSAIASSRAVLSEQQLENGVAVIDIGGTTTGIAIFEEGDLQFTSVIPIGGINFTNDLAIGLKTDPEIAEKVKLLHGSAIHEHGSETVVIKRDKESYEFSRTDVDEIMGARLEDLFEEITKELKRAGKYAKLPAGVVLTGGGAKLKNISEYAKDSLGLAARVGVPKNLTGLVERVNEPQFATAVGLMLVDAEGFNGQLLSQSLSASVANQAGGLFKQIIAKFRQ